MEVLDALKLMRAAKDRSVSLGYGQKEPEVGLLITIRLLQLGKICIEMYYFIKWAACSFLFKILADHCYQKLTDRDELIKWCEILTVSQDIKLTQP